MSTIRDPAYITDAGRTMMTAGGDVTYTKAVLYGQDISHLTSDQIKALTTIGNPLKEVKVGISDKQNTDRGTTVILEATFQNDNLANDLPYTAVGFFAQKGNDEKLIAVAVANTGAYLTATSPDGVATDALDLKLAITIGDATNVTATVDPAGSVTPATLNGAINKVTHDLTAKIDVKADQDDTEKSLATKADKTTVESDLATKADQSSLDETNAEVAKKANSEDVTKQLATKANVSDVDDALSKKDDTADVDQKIATVNKSVSDLSDTVSANKTATDASLGTKANASDVADNVKTLQANIDTKADKATVDAEIAKIDFTPYAKSADVAKDLQGYTTTADLTKLLAGKRDIADSYSRDELDKKFLQLSTDTSGKVSADQIAKLLASKVDKTDLTSQLQAITDSIATKANSANVTAELAKKDNTADVDAKIKTVTDLANTKANSVDVTAALDKKDDTSDVDAKIKVVTDLTNTKANANDVYNRSTVDNAFTEVRGRLSKLEGSQTLDSPDFNGITASGIYYITNNNGANIKNNPVDQWGVLIVSNGNGHRASQVYYPDDDNPPWYRSLDESTWRSWYQLSTRYDVNNATNSANAASNKVDTVLTNSYVRKQGMNQNGDLVEIKHAGVKQDNGGYAFDIWSDDWTAEKVHEVLGQLPNKANLSDVSALQSKVNTSNNLFNHMSDNSTWQGITGISNTDNAVLTSIRDDTNGGNTVGGNGAGIAFGGGDTKAVLSVDWVKAHAIITGGNGNAPVWHEDIAWKSDISNLQNIINQQNQTIQSLTTRLTNAENEIRYIKDNYIEGKRFPASQEAQANSWENENPQRIAFITK